MNLSFYYNVKSHQEEYLKLLVAGINKINGTEYKLAKSEDKRNVVCWGWTSGHRLSHYGRKNTLVLERGYLGDRHEWTSLGWNGLNGYASFYNENVSDDRWTKYWKGGMKPWQGDDSSKYALLCGQVFTDKSLNDCTNYVAFIQQKLNTLKKKYNRVMFRPHPLDKDRIRPRDKSIEIIDPTKSSLEENLKDARIVVAWNSNSLVEAIYNGIPFESNSRGSMVHQYMTDDLDKEPDRNDWGRKIAYAQWSREELTSGAAWSHIKAGCKE